MLAQKHSGRFITTAMSHCTQKLFSPLSCSIRTPAKRFGYASYLSLVQYMNWKVKNFSTETTSDENKPKSAVEQMVDVTGGQIGEQKPEEGKLYVAERAKNLVASNRKFQLVTYVRVPEDGKDRGAL